MIRQHYNHPSIFFWGYMNEIFLHDINGEREKEMVFPKEYLDWTVELAEKLDKIAIEEDPYRLSVMAIHQGELYNQTGISEIPKALGYNLYPGWYFGDLEGLGRHLDWEHQKYPDRNIILSEYGAGSDERLHSISPEAFDFTIEYQREYLESYLKQIIQRDFVNAASLWVQNDFGSAARGGSKPGINQKGIARFNRENKDSYFLYKANLNQEPMIYIASREWKQRLGRYYLAEDGTNPIPIEQPVDVYTNLEKVEMILNGKSLGSKIPNEVGKITWMLAFRPEENHLKAIGIHEREIILDSLNINFQYRPAVLNDPSTTFSSLGINIGSNAQYTDSEGFIWEADQTYAPGSFGYTGGINAKIYRKQIIDSQSDIPLYYSYRDSIQKYTLDLPEGEYDIEFHFAKNIETEETAFKVLINDQFIFEVQGKDYPAGAAFSRNCITEVKNGEILNLKFEEISGKPFLNALKVSRK